MQELLVFIGVSALVIVTPGQDTALTVRNTLLGGRGTGMSTVAGVVSGQAVWALAAAAGIAALLVASEPAFVALRVAGAAYLVYLGVQALRAAWSGSGPASPSGARRVSLAPRAAYRQGALSNLGNPKMAVFFASLLPQFAPAGGGAFAVMLLLGVLFCSLTLAWLSAYVIAVSRASQVLLRPRVRRMLDAVTGAVLVALGLRLASADR
jgi:threonine/homoserine/homoserine lactone efflux protein